MSCARKINEHNSLALNSAFNIFSIPPTNASVLRSFFREILPLSTVSQEGLGCLMTNLLRFYLQL